MPKGIGEAYFNYPFKLINNNDHKKWGLPCDQIESPFKVTWIQWELIYSDSSLKDILPFFNFEGACVFCINVFLCIICMHDTHRSQNSALDSVELKLLILLSSHESAGNWGIELRSIATIVLLSAEPSF